MRIVGYIYLAIGLFACAMPWLNAQGLLGEPDPLTGIFPLAVALPWSLLLHLLPDANETVSLAACVMGVLINFGIIQWLADRLGR